MSLYNFLFGINSFAPVLLKILELSVNDVPRFRDCFLEEDNIIIYTRTGGANRHYYDSEESCRENYPEYFTDDDPPKGPWNSTLKANKYFVRVEDDKFDSTYAVFYFRFPEEFAEDLKAISDRTFDSRPSDRWKALMEELRK